VGASQRHQKDEDGAQEALRRKAWAGGVRDRRCADGGDGACSGALIRPPLAKDEGGRARTCGGAPVSEGELVEVTP
jgi:hypothetical protein